MLNLIIAAVQSIAQVMVVVFLGSLLAKLGYFNMDKQRWLSKLNLVFFTPCLLFSNIASIISFEKLLAFWPIPMFYLTYAILNYTSSQVVSRLVGLSPPYRRFVQACVMFSNSNSLPIATISSLAVSDAVNILCWGSDDTSESIAARGISYTLFFAIFGNIFRWSYGYQLLQKKESDDSSSTIGDEEAEQSDTASASSSLSSASNHKTYQSFNNNNNNLLPDDCHYYSKPGAPPRTHSSVTISVSPDESSSLLPKTDGSNIESTNKNPNNEQDNNNNKEVFVKRIAKRINSFMSPPLYAAFLALFVGLTPLKPYLFDKSAFLYPSFTKAIEGCGKAAVPLILTCLGAQLVGIQSEQQEVSPQSKKPVATAIAIRMCLMPLLVFPIVTLFAVYGSKYSSLATDPVFITMMIVLGCTPTAINLVQITQVNHIFEEEMLRMLFWSYGVVCIPVCTIVVFVALNIVERLL